MSQPFFPVFTHYIKIIQKKRLTIYKALSSQEECVCFIIS